VPLQLALFLHILELLQLVLQQYPELLRLRTLALFQLEPLPPYPELHQLSLAQLIPAPLLALTLALLLNKVELRKVHLVLFQCALPKPPALLVVLLKVVLYQLNLARWRIPAHLLLVARLPALLLKVVLLQLRRRVLLQLHLVLLQLHLVLLLLAQLQQLLLVPQTLLVPQRPTLVLLQ
jgi:hypothetical protein